MNIRALNITFLLSILVFTLPAVSLAQSHSIDHTHIIRCLTPIILEYESNPELREELGQILGVGSFQEWEKKKQNSAQIMTSDTLMSESGRFRLLYEKSGDDAVPLTDSDQNGIPDYVERAAEYADSSWNHLVANLGFADPVPDLDNPIKIRFQKIRFYGVYLNSSKTIIVHNNFTSDPFPIENQDPEGYQLGALKVTIAHELKHAVQFVTISSPGTNWIEMDATMAEEVVFPNVKDYLNYLGIRRANGDHYDIFLNPGRTVPFQYYQATFGLYYRERFGDQFWVDVWSRARSFNTTNLFLMMEQELEERGEDPEEVFITMYLWHMASGSIGSVEGYGFKDKLYYPNIFSTNHSSQKKLPYSSVWKQLSQRSANYFEFFPTDSTENDELYLGLFRQLGTQRRVSLGLIYWMIDGTIQTEILRSDSDFAKFTGQTTTRNTLNFSFWGKRTPYSPSSVRRIGVAVVNPASYDQSMQFITGRKSNPSPRQLANFTLTTTNPDARTEAEALLDRVVLQKLVSQVNNPLELLAADVSLNGRATAFDAALILQKGTGALSQYPADPNNELFVPKPSWFTYQDDPVSSIFKDSANNQVQNLRLESVFGDPDDPNSMDDTLRVYLISDTPVQFNSSQIELDYDTSAVFYSDFSSNFSPSATFITSRNSTNSTRLRLAFASDVTTQPSDTLSTLFFTPKKESAVTLTLRHLELDESFVQSYNLTTTSNVRPNEGVSIERPSELPIATKLNPAYPNPFNPSTIIPFDISELSMVTLDVFDILGRRVATVVNEMYSNGSYSVPFNANSLGSGIYLVQLTVIPESNSSQSQRLTQRVTLIK